jgi:phosphotriesterase-related protein
VTGKIDLDNVVGVIDGHTHVWIDDVGAITPEPVILNDRVAIEKELNTFYAAGGRLMFDCQPGGCGRNGNKLHQISEQTQVGIIACTGFHLRRYYPQSAPIFDMNTETATRHFISELTKGLAEASHVKAGFIKIACENTLDLSPKHLIAATVKASLKTHAAIEVHTERGSDAENIMSYMLGLGLPPAKLILCHMDKRNDFELHKMIAERGVLLEYDTFLRPKYHPDENAWQLLLKMIRAGFEDKIVLATDLADAQMWQHIADGPGAVAMIGQIKARLTTLGLSEQIISKLVGGNIAQAVAY